VVQEYADLGEYKKDGAVELAHLVEVEYVWGMRNVDAGLARMHLWEVVFYDLTRGEVED
jgi:hypothetical protein